MEYLSQMDDFAKQWLFDPTVSKLIAVVLGIVVVVAVVRLIQHWVIGRYIQDTDLRYNARKAIRFLGFVVVFIYVAAVFSVQFSGLTVAFGIAGAGIAFALQEVIMSVAGWFAIVFGDFFKTGDRILLGGVRGDVIDIGVFRTTVMECGEWVAGDLYNGRIVRLSNSYVFKDPVFNYSHDFPFLWDEIVIPIKFGSDHKLVRDILDRIVNGVVGDYTTYAKVAWRDVVSAYRIEDARVAPLITMVFNENWMDFTVRYVVDYKARRITKDRLFTQILDAFQETEGKVVIASTGIDINVTDVPSLDVRTKH